MDRLVEYSDTAILALGLERHREPADRTRAISYAQIEPLWRREDGRRHSREGALAAAL